MPLAQDDIEFIKQHLGEWLAEKSMAQPPVVYEIELRERTIRVEEELKHQRDLMRQGFEQVGRRFEQVDRRFEQMDKRFEVLTKRMDRFMVWTFGMSITVGGVVIAAIRYYTQA